MATRKLVQCTGQSNTGPWHDLATWLSDRGDLNLVLAPRRVAGATDTQFTVPLSIPGFTTSKSLRGICVRSLRYFTLYNPCTTGYTSYPGTGRVAVWSTLPNGLAHTTTQIYVEQRFKSGANGVAAITRRLTGTTHTVSSVTEMTKTFVDGDVNTGTETINIPSHGFNANDRVRLMSTGTLPTGLASTIAYFVLVVDANNIRLSLTSGGAAVNITAAAGGGTHTVMHSYSEIGQPATVGSRLTVSPAFDPPPASGEEFTFDHVANGAGSTTTAVLSMNYGLLRNADLRSLRLRCISGANAGASRSISGWNDTTRTVTVATAFSSSNSAGDTFAIEPINGVAFDRFGLWLPWCPFERDLSASPVFGELSKVNPYPPGFDYPNHWHLPQIYGASHQTPVDTGGIRLTYPAYIAWHVGGGIRQSEILGEEVWVHACDFGGSSTAHREFELGTKNVAWYDPAQQDHWSIGATNGCFQRLLDETDAAIAAAAAVGDTLALQVMFRSQADADAGIGINGYSSTGTGVVGMPVWRDKFLTSNRAFRQRYRQEMTNRSLWAQDWRKLPIVHKLLSRDTVDQEAVGDTTTVEQINAAIQQLTAEDRYAGDWDPTGLDLWDGIHYFGYELHAVETGLINTFLGILAATDQSGEVELCNLALTNLGEAPSVTSVDPPAGVHADLCASYLAFARDSLLERRAWGQGLERKKLSLVTSESSAWTYCYVVPSDAGFILGLLPDGASDDFPMGYRDVLAAHLASPYAEPLGGLTTYMGQTVPIEYSEERRSDGTRVLYTNLPDAWLRYERRILNTRDYPTNLKLAIAWQLSSLLAGPIIKGDVGSRQSERCLQQVALYVSEAARTDAQNRKVKPQYVPKSIRARGW